MAALYQYEIYDATNKKSIIEFDIPFELTREQIQSILVRKPVWYRVTDISYPTIICYPDYIRRLIIVEEVPMPDVCRHINKLQETKEPMCSAILESKGIRK